MKIYAEVDITEWLDDKQEEMGEYDELFDPLVCAVETFIKNNPKCMSDNIEESLEGDMFEKQEKYLEKYKKELIASIFNILRSEE